MRLPESLRLRIQIWYGFLLATVLCVFAFAAYKYQQANDLRQADDQISHRMRVLLKLLPPPPPPSLDGPQFAPPPRPFRIPGSRASLFDSAEAPSYYYILWNPDGSLRTASKSAPKNADYPAVSDDDTHHSGERTRGEFRELFSFLASGECLLVGRSISADLAELRAYAKWLVAISTSVLILGLAVGWAIATRSLHSVSLISETARRIANGSLSDRIRIREKHSELGILAHTLNETFSKIENSFARQHQFVADAAHELRTPVAIILTQAQQTLSRERDSEVYRKALESCISAARRLRTLTDALLELAMHDAGVTPTKRNTCNVADLVREVAEHVTPLITDRELELILDLETVHCEVDRTQITQLILNLVSNAADHTPPGGKISVFSRSTATTAVLSVNDTGVGIPPEALPRIFDRFFRADSSRSRKTGGAGLGLAICKAIADAHQAMLQVQSHPGEGSTFTLELPLESAGVAPLRESQNPAQ